MSQRYFERIGYSGDAVPLIADIAEAFNLGFVLGSNVLEVGYEDCNVHVSTDEGEFVVKAFAKFRDQAQIERYTDIISAAIEGGVHHPTLHKADGEVLFTHPSGISLIVMDFIKGSTYFDTKTVPNDEELERIMDQAVKIHALPILPPELFDSWAIPHIHKMFEATEKFLDEKGKVMARKAIERYDAIDLARLDECFVHGDIISTNTIRGEDGKIWILDFAVSNVYPKIQELAVIAANLLHDPTKHVTFADRVERAMEAFLEAGGSLTDYEKEKLLDYALAGVAMEFMGGHKAKFIDNEDPAESDHWIELGRAGLVEVLHN